MTKLIISIVTFLPDGELLHATLCSLNRAIALLRDVKATLIIIDNTPVDDSRRWLEDLAKSHGAKLIRGQGNIGFGRGHNLALDFHGDYHLILNPDVELAERTLEAVLDFMKANPECGLAVPSASWADGSRQYLCKRYPSVLDLLLRGFAPDFVKRLFEKRLNRYEMRDLTGDSALWDPPLASGCFMLFTGDALRRVQGFDSRYFLYFEDFDLSLRIARLSRIAYVPDARIVHHGGRAAGKGWRHVRMFARSAVTFFNTHGWRLV